MGSSGVLHFILPQYLTHVGSLFVYVAVRTIDWVSDSGSPRLHFGEGGHTVAKFRTKTEDGRPKTGKSQPE